MKTIEQYQAEDGTVFSDKAECLRHDAFLVDLENAMSVLYPERELTGEEYIQHPKGAVRRARNHVIDIIAKHLGITNEFADPAKEAHHNHTIFGRIVDDSGNRAAYRAWSRFMSMSPITGREYSQPYYLLQAEKGA